MTGPAQLSAPMLRPGVRHRKAVDGVYVEFGDRSLLLKGAKQQPVILRIIGALDGSLLAMSARASLPEVVRPLFDDVLDSLDEAGMLTEGLSDGSGPDKPESPTVRHMQNMARDWRPCLADWTGGPVTVCAPKAAASALACLLRHSGVRTVRTLWLESTAPLSDTDALPPGVAAAPKSLLVWMGDAGSASDQVRTLVSAHEVTIPACHISDGAWLVGPACFGDLAPWLRVSSLAKPSGNLASGPPRHVLSALVYEVLQRRIAAHTVEARSLRPAGSAFRIISSSGTTSTHDVAALIGSGRRFGGDAPGSLALSPPFNLRDWFDPVVGSFADVASPLSDHPLAHVALAVTCRSPNGQESTEEVVAWGRTPLDAANRVLEAAVSNLVSRRAGHRSGAGRTPVFCSTIPGIVERKAAAYAYVDLAQLSQPRAADGADENEFVRLLLSLVGDLSEESPLMFISDGDPSVAWARLGGWTAAAVSSDRRDAVGEALGDLLSAMLLGRAPARQDDSPLLELRAAWDGGDTLTRPVQRGSAQHAPQVRMMHHPAVPPGFFAGYAEPHG